MWKNRLLFLVTGLAIGSMFTGFALYQKQSSDRGAESERAETFIEEARAASLSYYTGLPIYSDWSNQARESELRKHLLADHLRVASGFDPIASEEEIQSLARDGELVPLEQDEATPYYFFNVPERFRYLRPYAARGLRVVAERFQKKLEERGAYSRAKIAVSSVLRPAGYQQSLRGRNANASLVSSHSYAISFDVFYDDFFVDLRIEEPGFIGHAAVRRELGFATGRARRRQLQAILAETLLDLQREGFLYVIHEKNQRCFHITILPE